MKSFLTIAVTALLVTSIASCRKEKNTAQPTPSLPTTECTATIYGYFGPVNDLYYGATGAYSFGSFDRPSATSTSLASINTHIRFGNGAYNTADNCYYTLIYASGTATLCKISTAGSITYYSVPAGTSAAIGGLIYSTATNKLLVIQNDSSVNKVSEIIIGSGATYSVAPISTIPLSGYVTEIVSDPSSGDIYAVSLSNTTPNNYTLSKITTAGATLVDSGSGTIRGMRYSTSDNMIYGLHYSATQPFALIKINPSGGHTALADLPTNFNSDFYSTCIDNCSGRYIVSTLKYDTATGSWDESHGMIYQLDLSGTLIQQSITPGMYQGLAVKY